MKGSDQIKLSKVSPGEMSLSESHEGRRLSNGGALLGVSH
jgi:hypothetical protein